MIRPPQFKDSTYWISKTSKPNLRKAPLHDVWPLKLNALKRQSLKLPAMSESMTWSSSCTFQSVKISIPSQSPDCCQSFLTHHHLKTTEFRSGKGHKNSTQPFMEGILNDLKCVCLKLEVAKVCTFYSASCAWANGALADPCRIIRHANMKKPHGMLNLTPVKFFLVMRLRKIPRGENHHP